MSTPDILTIIVIVIIAMVMLEALTAYVQRRQRRGSQERFARYIADIEARRATRTGERDE